ncbi:hypothetical protein AeRB84_008183 [Aphanomyces euteiches]|nr:hypothetical protein AeRB84_008183 [Aphanomyces euteiches]
MRVLIPLAAFNQAPYDVPVVRVTHEQVAVFAGVQDLQTLQRRTLATLLDKRRLASADNWLTKCFGACATSPSRPRAFIFTKGLDIAKGSQVPGEIKIPEGLDIPKGIQTPRDLKFPKGLKDPQTPRDLKVPKGPPTPRDFKLLKASQTPRDIKIAKGIQVSRGPQTPRDVQPPKGLQVP